ncbi:MAG: AzlC family ABC transporter permease [Actinomycetota bacterium]|nr:AzlC family ABC transporter permease [Actinomycetota bacterium]
MADCIMRPDDGPIAEDPLDSDPSTAGHVERFLLQAVVVGLAVAAFGIAYGVAAVSAGMPAWLAVLSSVVVFAGASQFAFVAVTASADPLTGAISGILLNLRIIAFSLALAPRLGPAPLAGRILDSYLITDESTALAFEGDRTGTRRRLRIAGASVWLFWVAPTALGAYGGDLLGDVRIYGLDVAFPAAFVALLAPALRRPGGLPIALSAGLIALLGMQALPTGPVVLLAGLAVLPWLRTRAWPSDTGGAA